MSSIDKRFSPWGFACLMALSTLAAATAVADTPKPKTVRPPPHVRTHVYVGTIFMPGMVIYPRPPATPRIEVSPPPTVYVEKKDLEADPASTGSSGSFWYYCPPLQTYYPYTLECPEAWTPVTPVAEAGK